MPDARAIITPSKCGRLPDPPVPKLACRRIRLCPGNELGYGSGRVIRPDRKDKRVPCDLGDRGEVLRWVVAEVAEDERRQHGHDDRRQQERGAVGCGVLERFRSDASGRAGPVLYDDRLPDGLPDTVGDQACSEVCRAAHGHRNEDPDGAGECGLCVTVRGYDTRGSPRQHEPDQPGAAHDAIIDSSG